MAPGLMEEADAGRDSQKQLPELNSAHHPRGRRTAHGANFFTFLEYLLWVNSCSEPFTSRKSFSKNYSTPQVGTVNIIPNFPSSEETSPERFTDLPKVTQLVRENTGLQTRQHDFNIPALDC